MKKILFALCSFAILLTACEKNQLPQLPQNPYRMVVEYTPGSYTLEVPGNVTPDELYPWLSVSQNGNTVSFTVRRNTQDIIRRAEFTVAGKTDKMVISQKPHKLDGACTASIDAQSLGSATIGFSFSTKFADDYEAWGVAYGETSDVAAAKAVPQTGTPVAGKSISATITGLKENTDYYIWTYIVSTEGDKIFSPMTAMIPPVYVKAGEDVVAAITAAKEYAEIRVQGGQNLGAFYLGSFAKNKTITGSWNASFTEQDVMNNPTIFDGGNANIALLIAGSSAGDAALDGAVEVSCFDIRNGKSAYGGGVYAVGGPITVRNCYIHDNEATDRGGGIAQGKSINGTLNIVNNIIEGNKAAGHGAGISIETGNPTDGEPPYNYAFIVSNLIKDNISIARDGYASSIYTAYSVDVQIVNNTIVGNMNWNEYGGPYPGFKIRGDGFVALANNLVVGNLCSDCHKDTPDESPVYYRQDRHIDVSGAYAGLAFNIFEGTVSGTQNCFTDEQNTYMPFGFELSEVITADYKPAGKALGHGQLIGFTYSSDRHRDVNVCEVASILSKFNKDLAGNPRVVNDKVDCGCYQVSK